jgi:hypothetical protein
MARRFHKNVNYSKEKIIIMFFITFMGYRVIMKNAQITVCTSLFPYEYKIKIGSYETC